MLNTRQYAGVKLSLPGESVIDQSKLIFNKPLQGTIEMDGGGEGPQRFPPRSAEEASGGSASCWRLISSSFSFDLALSYRKWRLSSSFFQRNSTFFSSLSLSDSSPVPPTGGAECTVAIWRHGCEDGFRRVACASAVEVKQCGERKRPRC